MSVTAESAMLARRHALLNAPILPTMLRLGLPVIVVIVAQTAVGVLETYWVSRLGTDALAGVSLVLPIFVLMATMSNGGIGGGVSSAIARAAGAGRMEEANDLLVHTLAIAAGFGLIFTIILIAGGTWLYRSLGGEGAALEAAVEYSNWIFSGAILIWVVNLISSALRGAGEVRLPAVVTLAGAVLLIPLSPALIFGIGPIPAMGVAGAGLSVLIYYFGALVVLGRYLLSGRGVLVLRATALRSPLFGAILGVGLVSAAGTIMASLTVVLATGAAGRDGTEVLAGFGVASRLDSILIPILFGLGTAVVTMVGTATGAGDGARASRVAWTAAGLAFAATGSIGLIAALFPSAWIGLFSQDAAVLAAGTTYLSIVGPSYGAFGVGLMLYFASQGRGRMAWPFVAGAARLAITAGGAWLLVNQGAGFSSVCLAVAAGYLAFGAINVFGFSRRLR